MDQVKKYNQQKNISLTNPNMREQLSLCTRFFQDCKSDIKPEMEFLNINLAKDSSLLLHAVDNPFNWRILKKTIPFSAFKKPYK